MIIRDYTDDFMITFLFTEIWMITYLVMQFAQLVNYTNYLQLD